MRRRPVLPAAFAAVLLVVGQLVVLAHAAAERHVVCEEHGEEIEAVELAEALHDCDQDHLVGVDSEDGGEHEDCALARALHQSSAVPKLWVLPAAVAATSSVQSARLVVHAPLAAIYLLAPKTSPPT